MRSSHALSVSVTKST